MANFIVQSRTCAVCNETIKQ